MLDREGGAPFLQDTEAWSVEGGGCGPLLLVGFWGGGLPKENFRNIRHKMVYIGGISMLGTTFEWLVRF